MRHKGDTSRTPCLPCPVSFVQQQDSKRSSAVIAPSLRVDLELDYVNGRHGKQANPCGTGGSRSVRAVDSGHEVRTTAVSLRHQVESELMGTRDPRWSFRRSTCILPCGSMAAVNPPFTTEIVLDRSRLWIFLLTLAPLKPRSQLRCYQGIVSCRAFPATLPLQAAAEVIHVR